MNKLSLFLLLLCAHTESLFSMNGSKKTGFSHHVEHEKDEDCPNCLTIYGDAIETGPNKGVIARKQKMTCCIYHLCQCCQHTWLVKKAPNGVFTCPHCNHEHELEKSAIHVLPGEVDTTPLSESEMRQALTLAGFSDYEIEEQLRGGQAAAFGQQLPRIVQQPRRDNGQANNSDVPSYPIGPKIVPTRSNPNNNSAIIEGAAAFLLGAGAHYCFNTNKKLSPNEKMARGAGYAAAFALTQYGLSTWNPARAQQPNVASHWLVGLAAGFLAPQAVEKITGKKKNTRQKSK